MNKPPIDIKSLLFNENRRVADLMAELEASRELNDTSWLWTEKLSPSTKGGKCMLA